MRKPAWMLLLVFSLLAAAAGGVWWWVARGNVPRTSGAVRHEVYVWQREWGEELAQTISKNGNDFSRVVVLGSQITWEKEADGKAQAKVFRVPVRWAELKKSCSEIGAAVRIGGFIKGESYEGPAANSVEEAVKNLCAAARDAGVTLAEVQLDFDAAESKLDGYRVWVQAAKRAAGGVPVRVTALPSWLDQSSFAALAKECGGYVLQVHSLERPKRIEDKAQLCDATAARKSIELAARIGVPFRVAFPTYGYLLIFDAAGKYAALEAEGASKPWPETYKKRWLGSDAAELAGVVSELQRDRPANLEGVIWYRLPVPADRRNWRYETLAAVMAGKTPAAKLAVECPRSDDPKLREIVLKNIGDADARQTMDVRITWSGAELIASDALGGFEATRAGDHQLNHELNLRGMSDPDEWLGPGESRKIGWIRLDADMEVQGHAESAQNTRTSH